MTTLFPFKEKIVLHSNACMFMRNILKLLRLNSRFLTDGLCTFSNISHNVRILVDSRVKLIKSVQLKKIFQWGGKRIHQKYSSKWYIFGNETDRGRKKKETDGQLTVFSKLAMLLLSCYAMIMVFWQGREQSYFVLISINQTLNIPSENRCEKEFCFSDLLRI